MADYQNQSNAFRQNGHENEIRSLKARVSSLERHMDEIDDAITAGKNALRSAEEIQSSLNSAAGWGMLDLFGGGFVSGLVKHNRLDQAQRQVDQLRFNLRCFRTELADVSAIDGDLNIEIDGFLRFADYFFDGFFADFMVMDKINRSKADVERITEQIRNVLERLNFMMDSDQREWKICKDRLAQLGAE